MTNELLRQLQLDLQAVSDKSVREKAFQIYSGYSQLSVDEKTKPSAGWETAADSVLALRNYLSLPNPDPSKIELLKSRILAFDIKEGNFPDNFDLETGEKILK